MYRFNCGSDSFDLPVNVSLLTDERTRLRFTDVSSVLLCFTPAAGILKHIHAHLHGIIFKPARFYFLLFIFLHRSGTERESACFLLFISWGVCSAEKRFRRRHYTFTFHWEEHLLCFPVECFTHRSVISLSQVSDVNINKLQTWMMSYNLLRCADHLATNRQTCTIKHLKHPSNHSEQKPHSNIFIMNEDALATI